MGSTKYKITDKGDHFVIMRPRSKQLMQVMCWDADTAETCCAALNNKEAAKQADNIASVAICTNPKEAFKMNCHFIIKGCQPRFVENQCLFNSYCVYKRQA